MLLVTQPPTRDTLAEVYRRTALEGMAHSSPMRGEVFEMSDAFDPAWACESVAWNSGGEEDYRFADGARITLKSSGVLTIARGARYAYRASPAPFHSSMIAFPAALSARLAAAAPDEDALEPGAPAPIDGAASGLRTGVAIAGEPARALMTEIARACRAGAGDDGWYEERATLLYGALLADQRRAAGASAALPATKAETRRELARRAGLGAAFMHEAYTESDLDLGRIAREARLSRYHFVRVFSAVYGRTPMEYLAAIRIEAAARLLAGTRVTVGAVGRRAGFADRTSFFRQFRRRYGVSPKAYRAQN